MDTERIARLDDATLRRELCAVAARSRTVTAELLIHLAVFDARRLYRADGCPSMFAYCVEALHFSEGAAYKRIHAARAAHRFPRLFGDIATGRLHLAAVCLLAPHLKPENLEEFVAAATHRSKKEVEAWIAVRCPLVGPPPRATVTVSRFVQAPRPKDEAAPLFVPESPSARAVEIEPVPGERRDQASPRSVDGAPSASELSTELPPGAVRTSPGVDMSPAVDVAPDPIFIVRIPIDRETQALLLEVQTLLGHAVAPGDLATVFRRALGGLRENLLRRKAAEVGRPRTVLAGESTGRTIPAHARRVVWSRDGGRCTFTSVEGRRCSSRYALEYDHVLPVTRGGESTTGNLRLRCRPHNQLEAERAFGADFMERKRADSA